MAIESACIPLPSEVIMPFSGYLVVDRPLQSATGRDRGRGRMPARIVRRVLRRRERRAALAAERYGRYILIAPHEIEIADRFFERWGSPAVFFSRLLPVVRTFIAFPAGVARMRLVPFTIYTLLGSYIWCLALA